MPTSNPHRRERPATMSELGPAAVGVGGLGAAVAVLSWAPHLAMLVCSLTVVAAAATHHATLRRVHVSVLTLDDAVSAIAAAVAANQNPAPALLSHARSLTGADRAWVLVESTGEVRSIGSNGDLVERLEVTEVDRQVLDLIDRSDDVTRLVGRSAKPSGGRQVLAVKLSVEGQRAALLVGRGRRLPRFAVHQSMLLERLARHGGAAMTQRQLRGQIEAEAAVHQRAAAHDQLTGLVNRHQFRELVSASLSAGRRPAVLLIDLDHFKQVNDTMGHHVGDQLLAETAGRMRRVFANGTALARLGGDEFAVMVDDDPSESALIALSNALNQTIREPLTLDGAPLHIGASIGVAMSGWGDEDATGLLRRADVAMYSAKSDRTGVEFYRNELDQATLERLELLPALRHAIGSAQVDLNYQPVVDLNTGRPHAIEALIRWTTDRGKVVRPADTIAIAEETDLIAPLTRWVLDRAITDCSGWWDPACPLPVSVNVSGWNLIDDGFVADVTSALRRHGLPASALCLEVTEHSMERRSERCIETLERLRTAGITVSLDDFGTGHSALTSLTELPIDELKIDGELVARLGRDEATDRVVQAIVDLGLSLGLSLVAEGIESQRQADWLTERGCVTGQGFHITRPLSASALRTWLETRFAAAVEPPTPRRRSLYSAPTTG